ncbi:MAG: 4-hydroxy-tetrahydrodipicolinate reductase [Phycisphaerae bacterium]|nr:4-hydroxy-tetrahydrodipicolinate reductase [Gemmatimonadaceae bacterium]
MSIVHAGSAEPGKMRVALIGMGRMGSAIDALATDRGCTVVARLTSAETALDLTVDRLNGAQVAIEFTEPTSALSNAKACLAAGCPVVIGTTGWSHQLSELESAVIHTQTAALWAPNFALGVQLFLAVAEEAGRRFKGIAAFDSHVVETHHSGKKDAPSGTAIAIAQRLETGLGHEVPITSVRTGHVPGTHEIIFDAPFEQMRVTHEARDRRVFADGALVAARWLANKTTPGVYTMRDVVAP